MIDRASSPRRLALAALLFEAGLGAVAVLIGWLVGHHPWATVKLTVQALPENAAAATWGSLAVLPMVAALLVFDRYPLGPLKGLKDLVEGHLIPLFAPLSATELALVSLAAGTGEELLFRGLLQSGLADWFGPPHGVLPALAAASVVFGVCHWLSPTYAALATLVGLYLGWLFIATDNLVAPITAHALYDFVALVYLAKWKSRPGVAEGA